MLELCRTLGLASNVDLIFGWPRQTPEHMLPDLDTVGRPDVPHLTHYELNAGGLTDFARRHRGELPSVGQNLEMYRIAKRFPEAAGCRQATPCERLPWNDRPMGGTGVGEVAGAIARKSPLRRARPIHKAHAPQPGAIGVRDVPGAGRRCGSAVVGARRRAGAVDRGAIGG
jgi:hypothetical protein